MPNPQQLMQYAGSVLAIIALILGLIFGTGDLSSNSGGGGTIATNPAPSKPSTGGRTPDADGCVKSSPDYLECKQSKSPIGKKNPPLSQADIVAARNQQFNELVAWRKKDPYLRGIVLDENLNRSAQAFAEVLAKTPGDKIWHSTNRPDGVYENVARDDSGYKNFIAIFSNSPGHASTMGTNGRAPKVGIGIAQDPVTGHYFCVQHFAEH